MIYERKLLVALVVDGMTYNRRELKQLRLTEEEQRVYQMNRRGEGRANEG